jgi:hypothetical protein
MMEKYILQFIINKYHLNGLVEQVEWEIKDNNLKVCFTSPNKDMVGVITKNNVDLPNKNLYIYNTSQLYKMLNVMSDVINVTISNSNNSAVKLILSDDNFDISYSLSNKFLIPPNPQITEPDFDLKLNLTKDDFINIIKAKSAINDSSSLIISSGLTGVDFTFGEDNEHSNKINFIFKCEIPNDINFELKFNSDYIKDILNANKDCIENYIHISSAGLIKLEFNNDDLKSIYYLVSN